MTIDHSDRLADPQSIASLVATWIQDNVSGDVRSRMEWIVTAAREALLSSRAAHTTAAEQGIAPLRKPLDEPSHGTQVLLAWAAWLKQRKLGLARRSVVLTKGRQRLVVHEYVMNDGESTCGVIRLDDAVPRAIIRCGRLVRRGESRLRAFREWPAPLERVVLKLTNRGWKRASRDALATTEGGSYALRS